MRDKFKAIAQELYKNIDDIQLLTILPVIWSLITSTFLLDRQKNTYAILDYPILYYGGIGAVLAITVFSLLTMRLMPKRVFFLIMIFGSMYSAVDTYQTVHEPNITVGLFLYLFANSAYGFLRLGAKQKVINYVHTLHH